MFCTINLTSFMNFSFGFSGENDGRRSCGENWLDAQTAVVDDVEKKKSNFQATLI